jgi:hypothetical protein
MMMAESATDRPHVPFRSSYAVPERVSLSDWA